jgi:hypothetical protein
LAAKEVGFEVVVAVAAMIVEFSAGAAEAIARATDKSKDERSIVSPDLKKKKNSVPGANPATSGVNPTTLSYNASV